MKKDWWVIPIGSYTPQVAEGEYCVENGRKLWYFYFPHMVGEEGITCFETQREALEFVINNLRQDVARLQSILAEREATLQGL